MPCTCCCHCRWGTRQPQSAHWRGKGRRWSRLSWAAACWLRPRRWGMLRAPACGRLGACLRAPAGAARSGAAGWTERQECGIASATFPLHHMGLHCSRWESRDVRRAMAALPPLPLLRGSHCVARSAARQPGRGRRLLSRGFQVLKHIDAPPALGADARRRGKRLARQGVLPSAQAFSARLEAALRLLPRGARLADVGCDHGYFALACVCSGGAERYANAPPPPPSTPAPPSLRAHVRTRSTSMAVAKAAAAPGASQQGVCGVPKGGTRRAPGARSRRLLPILTARR